MRTKTPRNLKPGTLTIGMLGFDEANGLDVTGPIEAFSNANDLARELGFATVPYELVLIGLRRAPFRTESGLLFRPHVTLRDAPLLDTLIVPGGRGLREPATNAMVSEWIARNADRPRRIATVCTGIYGVAPTGLLDGRRVATHWRFADAVASRFPALDVDGNALFVRDGRFYTSGGITAGIDLALALIEEDYGPQLALATARELVVYLKRPGGQEQYSEPLKFQMRAADRFADLVAWIDAHPHGDLSVEALADRAHLSTRQFRRRFAAALGCAPAAYVENVRMAEARRRLAQRAGTVEAIAVSVGFASADAFRRAFERRFGVPPRTYRARFAAPQNAHPPPLKEQRA
jgi:transcriptional regulator GlxA family with amidase domain